MLAHLLGQVRVARVGPGRPRTRPARVLGDKAYSSRANRTLLSSHGIKATIAQPADQAASRKRRGRAGGRPPAFDTEIYKRRHVVERAVNRNKDWRGPAPRNDKPATPQRGGVFTRAHTSGPDCNDTAYRRASPNADGGRAGRAAR